MEDDLLVEFVAGSLTAMVLARAFERLPNPNRTPHPLDDERGLNAWEAARVANLEKGSQVLVDRYKRILTQNIECFRPWFGGRQIFPESYAKFSARTAHEQAIKAASTVVHLKNQPPRSPSSWVKVSPPLRGVQYVFTFRGLKTTPSWFKIGPLKDWKFEGLSEEVRQELLGWLTKHYSPQEAQTLIDRAEAHAGLPLAAHRIQFVVPPSEPPRPISMPPNLDQQLLAVIREGLAAKKIKRNAKQDTIKQFLEKKGAGRRHQKLTTVLKYLRDNGEFDGPTRDRQKKIDPQTGN